MPVAINGPGALGSEWTTVVGVSNPHPHPWQAPGIRFINYANCPIPEGCVIEELGPGGAAQIIRTGADRFDAPGGFFIHLLPPGFARPYLYARFGSQPGTELGAELPLPTDLDFSEFLRLFPLITIGAAPVRTHLRIYELTGTRTVVVRVYARPMFSSAVGGPRFIDVVVRPQQPPGTDPVLLPSFGQVSLTDAFGDTFGLADITIQQQAASGPNAPAKLWAFITVTHTETHQVGVFTPVEPRPTDFD